MDSLNVICISSTSDRKSFRYRTKGGIKYVNACVKQSKIVDFQSLYAINKHVFLTVYKAKLVKMDLKHDSDIYHMKVEKTVKEGRTSMCF